MNADPSWWAPAAAAIVAGIFALLGVVITNMANQKAKEGESRRLAQLAVEERRRAAGEAVYRAIQRLALHQKTMLELSVALLSGGDDLDEASKRLADTNRTFDEIDLVGVRLAIEIHFQDLDDRFDEVAALLRESARLAEAAIGVASLSQAERNDLVTRGEALRKESRDAADRLCSRIAERIK